MTHANYRHMHGSVERLVINFLAYFAHGFHLSWATGVASVRPRRDACQSLRLLPSTMRLAPLASV